MLNKGVLQPFELAAPRAKGLPKATHCQLKACVHGEELHRGRICADAQCGVTAPSPLREGMNGERGARVHHGCEPMHAELQLGGCLVLWVKVWGQGGRVAS